MSETFVLTIGALLGIFAFCMVFLTDYKNLKTHLKDPDHYPWLVISTASVAIGLFYQVAWWYQHSNLVFILSFVLFIGGNLIIWLHYSIYKNRVREATFKKFLTESVNVVGLGFVIFLICAFSASIILSLLYCTQEQIVYMWAFQIALTAFWYNFTIWSKYNK